MHGKDVQIPVEMQHLERDRRGYPIPYIVLRDKTGRPHFTVNDTQKVQNALVKGVCGISGRELTRHFWLVGGILSAFHEHGSYIDGPILGPCMRYALQVCPYLAAPKYARRIDDATINYADLPGQMTFQDNTMIPDRPALFVAIKTTKIDMTPVQPGTIYLRPKRPYLAVEFWQHGRQLTEQEALPIVLRELGEGWNEKRLKALYKG